MAQWATTSYKASYLYDTDYVKYGHKRVVGTVYGGSSWDGSGTGEGETPIGGEHSYIF